MPLGLYDVYMYVLYKCNPTRIQRMEEHGTNGTQIPNVSIVSFQPGSLKPPPSRRLHFFADVACISTVSSSSAGHTSCRPRDEFCFEYSRYPTEIDGKRIN